MQQEQRRTFQPQRPNLQPIPITEDQFLQISVGQLLAKEPAANNATEQLEQQIQCWELSEIFKCFKCLGFKCQQQPNVLQPQMMPIVSPKTQLSFNYVGGRNIEISVLFSNKCFILCMFVIFTGLIIHFVPKKKKEKIES